MTIIDTKNIQQHILNTAFVAGQEFGDDDVGTLMHILADAEMEGRITGKPNDIIEEARKRADKLIRGSMTG